MQIMRDLVKEGEVHLFITHKLNEIKAVADRCTVLRRGKYIGTVDVKDTTPEEMSEMMVGRKVNLTVERAPPPPERRGSGSKEFIRQSQQRGAHQESGEQCHLPGSKR